MDNTNPTTAASRANGRPSDAAFARAGVLIAAAMYDLAERNPEGLNTKEAAA